MQIACALPQSLLGNETSSDVKKVTYRVMPGPCSQATPCNKIANPVCLLPTVTVMTCCKEVKLLDQTLKGL